MLTDGEVGYATGCSAKRTHQFPGAFLGGTTVEKGEKVVLDTSNYYQ
jgi:hypothetical protein